LVGIGDDAAVIRPRDGADLIACCDLMVEGVHFRTEWARPSMIGHKALAVTLSDVAAMGGSARFAMISIALPARVSLDFTDELFSGIFDLAAAFGVTIIGGDTSSSIGPLFIDTSVIGDCPSGRAVTRGGAQTGDTIFVTGRLGASALGLLLLEKGSSVESEADVMRHQAMIKHLAPQPRLELGRALAEAGVATAMIDISDGLSTDLWHILEESGRGAVIRADVIPIDESVISLSGDLQSDPLSLALGGGEEYELLFTTRGEDRARVFELSKESGVLVTEIGEIVSGEGLQISFGGKLEALAPSGYEHKM
jgi:thiamine-monophosphate kinase